MVWRFRKCFLIIHKTNTHNINPHPFEYTLDMLIAPPSIASSFSFSFSLVAAMVWHSTEGWYLFSASEPGLCASWDTKPPGPLICAGEKKFSCEEIGIGKALFIIPAWWSIVLEVVGVLKPDSTFWVLPGIVGEMLIFFSSFFEAKSSVGDGLDPLSVPRCWKLSAGLSLFLCYKIKNCKISFWMVRKSLLYF